MLRPLRGPPWVIRSAGPGPRRSKPFRRGCHAWFSRRAGRTAVAREGQRPPTADRLSCLPGVQPGRVEEDTPWRLPDRAIRWFPPAIARRRDACRISGHARADASRGDQHPRTWPSKFHRKTRVSTFARCFVSSLQRTLVAGEGKHYFVSSGSAILCCSPSMSFLSRQPSVLLVGSSKSALRVAPDVIFTLRRSTLSK